MRKMIFALAVAAVGLCSSAYAQFDSTKANKPVAAMAPKVAAEAASGGGAATFSGFLKDFAGRTFSASGVSLGMLSVDGGLPQARSANLTATVSGDSLCLSIESDNWDAWHWFNFPTVRGGCVNSTGGLTGVYGGAGGIFVDKKSVYSGGYYGTRHADADHEFRAVSGSGLVVYVPGWRKALYEIDSSCRLGGSLFNNDYYSYAEPKSASICLFMLPVCEGCNSDGGSWVNYGAGTGYVNDSRGQCIRVTRESIASGVGVIVEDCAGVF